MLHNSVEVPLFTEAETRALLTEPLRYSPLWPQDDPKRPHFAPTLWGENGIERIHAEAGGWPHLVQLIAETVIDLLNEGTAPHADATLLERALDKAIVSGDTVLRELVERESRMPASGTTCAASAASTRSRRRKTRRSTARSAAA
jgi:hypothetical protein